MHANTLSLRILTDLCKGMQTSRPDLQNDNFIASLPKLIPYFIELFVTFPVSFYEVYNFFYLYVQFLDFKRCLMLFLFIIHLSLYSLLELAYLELSLKDASPRLMHRNIDSILRLLSYDP